MTKLPIPSGWNQRVQSAILQAISNRATPILAGQLVESEWPDSS